MSINSTYPHDKCLVSYGYYPMLVLLQDMEDLECYEECEKIQDALNKYATKNSISIPNRLPKNWQEDYKNLFRHKGFSGEVALKNIGHYVLEIKKELGIKC